jgi:hypothetical protein
MFYYENKCHFILKSFGKELKERLKDDGNHQTSKSSSYANDLTLFQMIPQDLHGTFFFKVI